MCDYLARWLQNENCSMMKLHACNKIPCLGGDMAVKDHLVRGGMLKGG